jgi:Zn-dependent peptidase ImmA (M78 family)
MVYTRAAREAGAEAERVLAAHWDGTIPVDPARIAQAMGIRVVDAYLDPDVAGAIRKDRGKQASIYLNAYDAPTRKRFTCAHEIAHFVKHEQKPGDFEYIDYRDALASTGQLVDERYANAFAAALLMPERHVRRLHADGLDDAAMARRLGVSREAMVNRLKNLGLYR